MPLVAKGLATPDALRTTAWTLDGVYDALEALAVVNTNEGRAAKAAEKAAGKPGAGRRR